MIKETKPMEIDLAQSNWPFCMLELKNALKGMHPGQLLEVTVSDPKVLTTMEKVIEASPDQVLKRGARGQLHVITIQKGLSPWPEE